MHWPRKHEVVGLNPELISLPSSSLSGSMTSLPFFQSTYQA